ncbi:hypothetical protein BH11PLA2_BH11PLA2_05680 [soil metagenome]
MQTIVIIARGLGANGLGAYGNEWVATPHLDRLAAEGVVYDRHYATDLALLTLAGTRIVVKHLKDAIRKLKPDADVVIECSDLLPPWNVKPDVFETYCEEDEEPLEPWPEPPLGVFDREDAVAWDRLQASYATVVTMFDAAMGKLLDAVDLDVTTIVVTSDAGFPLGEHSMVGADDSDLYEELVHLPLMVRWPKAQASGDRIDSLTQPDDMAAILSGETVSRNHVVSQRNECRSVRTTEWTLLQRGDDVRLFRRPGDNWEINDLARQFPEVVRELMALCGGV